MSIAPKVLILVLNWNGWQDTIECLESVFKNAYFNYQAAVVDNNSDDNSIEKIIWWAEGEQKACTLDLQHPLFKLINPPIQKPVPYIKYSSKDMDKKEFVDDDKEYQLILIQTDTNTGFAGGNNVGIKYALLKGGYDYVWLLNNDTIIDEEALVRLVEAAEREKNTGVVGSKWLYYDKPGVIQLMGGCKLIPYLGRIKHLGENKIDNRVNDKNIAPDYIGGASFLIRTETIKQSGLLDEDYFLYWEDAEWCERIKRKGWGLKCVPESVIYHKSGASAGSKSTLADYYGTRNAIAFIKKYYGKYIFSAAVFIIIGKLCNRIYGKRLGRIGLILRAAVDGLKNDLGKKQI